MGGKTEPKVPYDKILIGNKWKEKSTTKEQ
jgi:hypothetical protein